MKKWNWQKILNVVFAALLTLLGGNEVNKLLAPEPVQAGSALAAVPGTPVYYVVNVQVIWKATANATPGTSYIAINHRVQMQKIPTLGSSFNEVNALYVNGKIKAPVDGFVPVYAYTAEVLSRIGIPLADDGKKPAPIDTKTE